MNGSVRVSEGRPSANRIQNSAYGSPDGLPASQPGTTGARYSNRRATEMPRIPPSRSQSAGSGSFGGVRPAYCGVTADKSANAAVTRRASLPSWRSEAWPKAVVRPERMTSVVMTERSALPGRR